MEQVPECALGATEKSFQSGQWHCIFERISPPSHAKPHAGRRNDNSEELYHKPTLLYNLLILNS